MAENRPESARKRAPRGTLDRARVIAAATAIMDADGVEAVTIRRIADELRVRPMSLYTHFRSKDEVLACLYNNLLASVDVPPATEGLDGVRTILRSYYALLVEHAELARIHLTVDTSGPADLRLSETLYAILLGSGLSGREAVGMVATLIRFTIGAAAVHPTRKAWDEDPDAWPRARRSMQDLPAAEYPTLHTLGQGLPAFTQDELFEYGLELIARSRQRADEVVVDELTYADYRRAERLLPHNMARFVPTVRPRWESGDRFWYRVDTAEGRRFVLADPAAGTRAEAFDHDQLAAALSRTSGTAVEGRHLPFTSISRRGEEVEFTAFGTPYTFDGERCTERDADPAQAAPHERPSPDGKWLAFVRGHNVWVRSADGAEEFALTTDGEENFGYAMNIDVAASRILHRNTGVPQAALLAWSPDSTRLITHQTDQRAVREQVLVESTPRDGGPPVAHSFRYAMPEDEQHATVRFVVLDVAHRSALWEVDGPAHLGHLSPFARGWVWWADDSASVYFLRRPRYARSLGLYRLDVGSGETELLVEECGDTRVEPAQVFFDPPMVQVLRTGEVLWYSQRDGWGHLYLCPPDGKPATQLTRGAWAVRKIVHVDEEDRVVVFLASGLVPGEPYARQLCSVALDGTGFTRLTDDEADHDVTAAPSGAYFVDSASTVETPPWTVVRDAAGAVVVELERPAVAPLVSAGWTPPERFTVKAADGITDLHGTLWRPHGFDPARRYPLVDSLYPGPQTLRTTAGFGDPHSASPEAIAALGFAVLTLDARGTPGRSKAFHDASYGNLGNGGFLEDHVAAIRELGQRHSWIDTDRVGAVGLSGGGFATARAMFTYPGVFKVGVALCGDHDIRHYLALWADDYLGEDSAQEWADVANPPLASALSGKLLLVHGELDDNVLPYQTLNLVDALIDAGKDFDLLMVPGVEHTFQGRYHYVVRRMWDYLVRHLLGAEPPAGFALEPFPARLDSLTGQS
ncbi:DPP IV N-terminal domain-containing protein [Streptomyces sp. Inha503]|uniref:DPP IV N-terminal domain-containing protein n=1 Tax=Streptomyces sp. Inha503 TaxID=3383314 RepID=UPI0039A22789